MLHLECRARFQRDFFLNFSCKPLNPCHLDYDTDLFSKREIFKNTWPVGQPFLAFIKFLNDLFFTLIDFLSITAL